MNISDIEPRFEAVDAKVSKWDADLKALAARMDAMTTPPGLSPPPLYDKWKADVLKFAKIHAAKFSDAALSGAQRLDLCYYDGPWIYRTLADLLQNRDFLKARDEAVVAFRDGYLMAQATPGQVAGWMIFPHGLYYHFKDTGDEASKRALLLMAQHAAFAQEAEPIYTWLAPVKASREAAYNLMCKLFAQDLGQAHPGIDRLRDICLEHLSVWRRILEGRMTPTAEEDCRCFMVGLTAHALIEYVTRATDVSLVNVIRASLRGTFDLMWEKMYDSEKKAMAYTDRSLASVGDRTPAPDVNMLIAPAYAWLGQRERADLLFEGSVLGAYLTGYKQFNQSVRWVGDYFTWRKTVN